MDRRIPGFPDHPLQPGRHRRPDDRTTSVSSHLSYVRWSGLRTLYVTSAKIMLSSEDLARESLAGALFALDVGVAGLPEAPFSG